LVKRLRVAVVIDALYPWHKGGKEVRYLHLLRGLPDYEMDVVVYSMRWWDKTPDVLITGSGSLTYVAICPRVPMYRGARRSLVQAVLFALSAFRLLTRKFDVIEADHMPYLQIVPLRIVAWIKRVPLIITWHEVWGGEGWRTYMGSAGFAAALVERICARLPDRIIVGAPGIVDKVVALGAKRDRIDLVLNPLDFDRLLVTSANTSAPEFLFVGRLIDHKQANLAIEATEILVERGHDVRLGIVGVGPEESRLRAQVADSGLVSRVTFYGAIDDQPELWSLIRGSRVLLAPSVREGFGLVVAESLALGTPVVCAVHSENESSKLVGPKTGSNVPAFDARALADAAEYWLNDNSERSDRVQDFLSEHRELAVENLSAAYAKIIRSVA
jgi:glycosyltransferase involved in cell wall biosynthesis